MPKGTFDPERADATALIVPSPPAATIPSDDSLAALQTAAPRPAPSICRMSAVTPAAARVCARLAALGPDRVPASLFSSRMTRMHSLHEAADYYGGDVSGQRAKTGEEAACILTE